MSKDKNNSFNSKIANDVINQLKEETHNGLKITQKAQKDSKVNNDEYLKDSEKRIGAAYDGLKDDAVENNKFNYKDDKQKEFHDEMEIMNGLEMNTYANEPNDIFKARAEEAISGSSRMGNNPEWANVVPKGQGGDPDFGKNLVGKIKSSKEKRDKAEIGYVALGDDIELTKTNRSNMRKLSFEGIMDDFNDKNKPKVSLETIFEGEEICQNDGPYQPGETVKFTNKNDGKSYLASYVDNVNGMLRFKNDSGDWVTTRGLGSNWVLNKVQNNNGQIKETMKRLKFNKIFNGVENAVKLIPEAYKVDGKTFQLYDGIEKITVKWDGNIFEGAPIILASENSELIKEDKNRMFELMGYSGDKEMGTPNKTQRLQEDQLLALNVKKMRAISEGKNVEETKTVVTESKIVVESDGKFKAQKLDLGEYEGKYVTFKKANYLREGEDKNITGVEYHLVIENSSLPKEVLTEQVVQNNKNKKPMGKTIKFNFYSADGIKLDSYTKESK